jgi:uncharacterized membrane protein
MNTSTNIGPRVRNVAEQVVGLSVSASIVGIALMTKPAGPPIVPALALWTHLITALAGLVLGGVVLYRPKGTASHRWMGRTWVAVMVAAAISSLFIQSWGRFSFIHFFSVWTLFSLAMAIKKIRAGDVQAHLGYMRGTYFGLVFAGVLAVALPGRVLWRWVMG